MIAQEICDHLEASGFVVSLDADHKRLTVQFDVGNVSAKLIHMLPTNDCLSTLPAFFLENPLQFGQLAHVAYFGDKKLGGICVGDSQSISINYEVPELVYAYSLNRHIQLIRKLVANPEWNAKELMREFTPNWALICDLSKIPIMYCASTSDCTGSMQTKEPDSKANFGLRTRLLSLGDSLTSGDRFDSVRRAANWIKRPISGKSIMLSLDHLDPAPIDSVDMADWYMSAINHLSTQSKSDFARYSKLTSNRHWIIFNATTKTGVVRCAIRLLSRNRKKRKLPQHLSDCMHWEFAPVNVSILDREAVLPRSGAAPHLLEKSVLIVGCGSVGSELANAVACAGVGSIHISDPEDFSTDNLYRHTLSVIDVGFPKSMCVCKDLETQYPWVSTVNDRESLQSKQNIETLNQYDLIIVAIGAPTIERQFHDFVSSSDVNTPVLYTWLEGYGIGGHAILDIPASSGCLRCAYLDPDTCAQGLASNLNFIAADQDITVTLAGCGHQFIPYSGIAAKTTAAMAGDLAIRYLDDQIPSSSKVSWKGVSQATTDADLTLTYRYEHFKDSLVVQPLYNSECDICDG